MTTPDWQIATQIYRGETRLVDCTSNPRSTMLIPIPPGATEVRVSGLGVGPTYTEPAESKNMDEAGDFFEPHQVRVAAWYPQKEGEGKPEQVHVVMSMTPVLHIVIRLKSRAGALAFIADLQEHTDKVWPPQ